MDLKQQITDKLQNAFEPELLHVVDESHMHRVPKGAQTHFKATIVSPNFEGLTRLERHKKVYRVLLEELDGLLKAFSVNTHTPQEWKNRQGAVLASPPCLGGGKKGANTSTMS